MKKNEIALSFVISDFNDVTHNDITSLLGIQPNFVRIKGQKKNPKNPNSSLIEINKWGIDSGLDKHSDFDDQLNSLLDIIEAKKAVFQSLCNKYTCEVSCGMFIYFDNGESTPWIHLDSRYNNTIKEMNIEFDLDLYIFPYNENKQ